MRKMIVFDMAGTAKYEDKVVYKTLMKVINDNRPMPGMIQLAMNRFSVKDSKQVVKLGDSTIDIEDGQNAGCGLSIGITTGTHTQAQLESAAPDYVIHNLGNLVPLLNLTA